MVPGILEHPVDVHVRDPERIGQITLGERQLEGMVLHQLDRSQPHQQFAQHMRHAGRSLTPPDTDHPLAKHGRIHCNGPNVILTPPEALPICAEPKARRQALKLCHSTRGRSA